jgi:hypothetical protein
LFYCKRGGLALFMKQGRQFNAWLVFHRQFLGPGTQVPPLLTQRIVPVPPLYPLLLA